MEEVRERMRGLALVTSSLAARGARSWMSSARTNDGLVSALMRDRVIQLPEVERALRRVDRRDFARADGSAQRALDAPTAYADAPRVRRRRRETERRRDKIYEYVVSSSTADIEK